jgi:hypothetical protein
MSNAARPLVGNDTLRAIPLASSMERERVGGHSRVPSE